MFITFEGIDGCGKSTQMRLLAGRLRTEGYRVFESVEPGGTSIGRQVRRILLDAKNQELCPLAELLLYFACRAQNVEEWILPALARGEIVVSDRFTDSTMAYQGVGRGLGKDLVRDLHRIACRSLTPDLTLLIDIDLDTSLERAHARNREMADAGGTPETRMDDQEIEFHRRVRDAYTEMVQEEPERFIVVDGRSSIASVADAVWAVVAPRLGGVRV